MSTKTGAKSPVGGGVPLATGTYTGDGNATQAIVNVGFQPKFVLIYLQTVGGFVLSWGQKTDQDGLNTQVSTNYGFGGNQVFHYDLDHIISLDAGGFTVGDGTGNANVFNVLAQVYTWVAWG